MLYKALSMIYPVTLAAGGEGVPGRGRLQGVQDVHVLPQVTGQAKGQRSTGVLEFINTCTTKLESRSAPQVPPVEEAREHSSHLQNLQDVPRTRYPPHHQPHLHPLPHPHPHMHYLSFFTPHSLIENYFMEVGQSI